VGPSGASAAAGNEGDRGGGGGGGTVSRTPGTGKGKEKATSGGGGGGGGGQQDRYVREMWLFSNPRGNKTSVNIYIHTRENDKKKHARHQHTNATRPSPSCFPLSSYPHTQSSHTQRPVPPAAAEIFGERLVPARARGLPGLAREPGQVGREGARKGGREGEREKGTNGKT